MDGADQPTDGRTAGAPTKADLRRAQVLEAAASCFNREGFRGASMASIAGEAEISVGQIYRYFDNKEAVIAALVEQSLADLAWRVADVRARSDDPVEHMVAVARHYAEKVGETKRAALTLEFLAEAARNPRIAEIVRAVDMSVRSQLKDILLRGGASDDDQLDARLNLVVMLVDGWAVRAVKDPSLQADDYINAVRPLFEVLVAGKPCQGAS